MINRSKYFLIDIYTWYPECSKIKSKNKYSTEIYYEIFLPSYLRVIIQQKIGNRAPVNFPK